MIENDFSSRLRNLFLKGKKQRKICQFSIELNIETRAKFKACRAYQVIISVVKK